MTTPPINAIAGTALRDYLRGCAIVLLGGFLLSLGVFGVRSAAASNAWQYVLWRALGFTTAILIIAALRDARNPVRQLAGLRTMAWIACGCMALSQVTFNWSIKAATFAEVFLICSLAPVFAATLAWPLLGERIGWTTVVSVSLGIAGVAVMTAGEVSSTNVIGQMSALVSALAFAGYTLCTRGSHPQDLDAALIGVGILTALAGLAATQMMGLPLSASLHDSAIAFGHGALLLSTGLFLFGQGSRYVPAVTFTLLAQAEAVLSPLWGYLFFAETPTPATIAGGALILTAVVIQALAGSPSPTPKETA